MRASPNDKAPPRIAMIIDRFPPEFSGAGRQLAALAPRLAALGCAVTVVTGSAGEWDAPADVSVVRLTENGGGETGHDFPKSVRRWMRAQRRTFDIVHGHGTSRATVQAAISATVMRKPYLLKFTLLGGDDPGAIAASRFGAQKLLVLRRSVRAFIAPSTAIAQTCHTHRIHDRKVHIIPNGVDTGRFRPLLEPERRQLRLRLLNELGWDGDSPLAVYLGSVEPRKGVDLLPDAWLRIIREIPSARLVMVGPTLPGHESYAEAVSEAFSTAGDTVRFVGDTSSPQSWLQAASVFLFPSRGEGLPNAVLEAQACGVPVVATALPGIIDDVIDDGVTGMIVPAGDSAAAAEATVGLLRDDALRTRMGTAAVTRVADRFALDRIAERYLTLYNALLRRSAPALAEPLN